MNTDITGNAAIGFRDDIADLDETKHLLEEAVILPMLLPNMYQGIHHVSQSCCNRVWHDVLQHICHSYNFKVHGEVREDGTAFVPFGKYCNKVSNDSMPICRILLR